jgi:DNA segregation ATPase FtsK/SpoIIIE-like protein
MNMFKRNQKNYLELNVRVSYDEKTDSINITSKDKNLPKDNGGFHLTLSGGRNTEQTLRTMLEDAGIIAEEHIIPSKLPYEEISDSQWDRILLGKAGGSNTVFWNPTSSPNLLLTGVAGSGKSVIERNIIFHCLQHPDRWRILAIDPYRVELRPYKKYSPVVERVVAELEDAVEICRYAHGEMMHRYKKMEELGINNYQDLPDVPHAIMFLVDAVSGLLTMSGVKTDEGKAEDKMKGEISMLVTKIARLGRAAGIHLVLASQRPSYSIFSKELMDHMTTRIVMGRADTIHSTIVFGNDEATRIPWKIKGRGYIQENEQGKQFQAAFAPLDWYDEWLKKNPTADSDVDTNYIKEN